MKPSSGVLREFLSPTVLITLSCAVFLTTRLVLTDRKLERLQKTTFSILEQSQNASSRLAQLPTREAEVIEFRSNIPLVEVNEFMKKSRVDYGQIWMSPTEINMVLRYINGVKTYLEWGSGGSTLTFPRFVSRLAVSIEHDDAWCNKMKAKLASDAQLKHVQYHCVPVRRGHKGWGSVHGFEEGTYIPFEEYIDHIDKVGQPVYDLVLIDGRARVDAAIKALSYISDESVVVLHDFSRVITPAISNYRDVLKYYDIREYCSGTAKQGIGILKRKRSLKHLEGNRTAVQLILDKKYKLNQPPPPPPSSSETTTATEVRADR